MELHNMHPSPQAGESDIAHILMTQLRQLLRTSSHLSTLELAIRAAIETGRDARAWWLVTLAGRLREENEIEHAFTAINAAVALDATPEARRAAYTCAVAIHVDEGDLMTAKTLGEGLLAEGHDEYLLNAMARVYWELYRETEDSAYRDRWQQIGLELEQLTPDGSNSN